MRKRVLQLQTMRHALRVEDCLPVPCSDELEYANRAVLRVHDLLIYFGTSEARQRRKPRGRHVSQEIAPSEFEFELGLSHERLREKNKC